MIARNYVLEYKHSLIGVLSIQRAIVSATSYILQSASTAFGLCFFLNCTRQSKSPRPSQAPRLGGGSQCSQPARPPTRPSRRPRLVQAIQAVQAIQG
ncbi:hypothetical protein BDZ91DRAFT_373523 [Kalaharituber pfeilii]|nr:hypothetical protein BDZ91DRAFT_373523 [Kalaharituber pfeilii]